MSIITLTPVVMTVIATLLAGLSSSEMTQAMYHRSIAGQNQSKAGDQWGFFQAKRIRGTELEMQVEHFPPSVKPGKLEPAVVQAAANRLTSALEQMDRAAAALATACSENSRLATLQQAARQLADRLHAKGNVPKDLQKTLQNALDEEHIFVYLGSRELPRILDPTADDPQAREALTDDGLRKVTAAISQRRPDQEIAGLLHQVKEETLRKAIETSELQGLATEKASDHVDDALNDLVRLTEALTRLAGQSHLVVRDIEGMKPPAEDANACKAVDTLVEADQRTQTLAEELNGLVKAARYDYTSRRYRRESQSNLQTALLYEAQVHLSSERSNSHRVRSQFFFFGMLGAQAAVAIASMSLAARKKSLLWSLATVAGLAAMGFSGWVYLSM